MDARQKKIFQSIVREHIATGMPVGSNLLVAKTGINLSSATLRNEMAELEEAGLLVQPHTSAGRVPTEEGYKFYIKYLMKEAELDKEISVRLKNIFKKYKDREAWKNFAKEVAEISGETSIVAFGKDDIYYTGFANFFRKPEMAAAEFNFGAVIDRMNEAMRRIFEMPAEGEIKILVGTECPFSETCSAIFTKIGDNLFMIFGLTRMDYGKNFSILNFLQKLFSNSY